MASEKLAVIWSSGDPMVAHKVCFMYTHNAKRHGWFDQVLLVVWGPSAELLARDAALQSAIQAMLADGGGGEARAIAFDLGMSQTTKVSRGIGSIRRLR